MNEQRHQLTDHGLELAPLRARDHGEPPLARFGRVGARLGIQQRQPEHPLRGPAHDLESDVAAQRKAAEREALRCLGEHPLGQAGDAVGTGQIATRIAATSPSARDLGGVQALVQEHPGQQNQRRPGHRVPRRRGPRGESAPGSPDQRGERLELGRARLAQPLEKHHLGVDDLDAVGRIRSRASARASARREATASATTIGCRPSGRRPSAVCRTQTCASMPQITISGRIRPCSAALNPRIGGAGEVPLGVDLLRQQQRRERRHGRPEPLRVLLRGDDRHLETPCRLDQQPAALDAGLAVPDRRREALLHVDHEKGRSGGIDQQG